MKKYLFLLILPLLFFLPKNVLAAEPIQNITNYEFYWKALNTSNGVVDEDRVQLRPLQMLHMGISAQDYSLIRIGPLINFQPLGYNSTYSADVLFYIETYTPFDIVDPFCGFWSNGGDKSSCTLNKVSEIQIDSRKTLVTYKASYNWTSSTGYAEFILNFGSTAIRPNETTFFYQINDFRGDVSEGQIIVDGLEETNKKLDGLKDSQDKTNDLLEDDNVDGAKDTASSFFDDFSTSDNGGISGIVTAPLTAVNKMLDGTCTPLTTTFKGKTISLECGTTMWNKLNAIRDFLNLVLGGFLCYQICLKIFKLVNNLKDPENDKIEVMDL